MRYSRNYYASFILIIILQVNVIGSIFYGQPAAKGQFKYVVGLTLIQSGCRPYCTGALIDSSHVITAGHCVYGRDERQIEVAAAVGEWRFNLYAEYRQVDTIHLHPDYHPGLKDVSCLKKYTLVLCECILGPSEWKLFSKNDIAVLTLQRPFAMGHNIGLVSLPGVLEPPPYDTECLFAGWGTDEFKDLPSTLRWAKFTILQRDECRAKGETLRDNELCVLDADRKAYTGGGDSGGPLVCNGVIVGVLHVGSPGGKYPSTFPIVSHHLDFIYDVLGI